ncbi:MAG: restriction endonuclease subunit S [Candidatus Auribacterota bacterium]|jgi:type I restriction enzyme S subunit|nr:restriction endonuclease subunit S [Candidatus Auribacterota bacterium]
MVKWIETTLGEEFEIVMGQSPSSEFYNTNGEGLPFFQGKKEFSEKYPTIEKWTTEATKKADKGDILLSVRAPIGAVNISPAKCGIGRGLAAIKPNSKTRNSFIFYLLQSLESELKKRGAGVTFTAITKPNLLGVPIQIPVEKNDRNKIVDEIETQFTRLDSAIQSLKTIKNKLELYRSSISSEAFQGKLSKKWRDLNKKALHPKDSLLNAIECSNKMKIGKDKPNNLPPSRLDELDSLPNNWFWTEAHKICSSVRDGTHDTPKYVDNGIPLVTSKNLSRNGLDFSKIQYISNEDHSEIKKRSGVEKDDILFGMIGTIGNPTIIDSDTEFSIKNVGLFKKNTELLNSKYLKYWLASGLCVHKLKKLKLIKGTTQQFIPLGHLRILPIPYCDIKEQNIIVNEIESRFSVIDKVEEVVDNALIKAERLRKSILKSAFEGKLVK